MTDVAKALRQAFSLGQTYWQQADSESYSQNRKSDETRVKFEALVAEALAAQEAAAVQPQSPELTTGPLGDITGAAAVQAVGASVQKRCLLGCHEKGQCAADAQGTPSRCRIHPRPTPVGAAAVGAWSNVRDHGLPPCDGVTVYVGENEAGYMGCFNQVNPDGLTLMGSPEACVAVFSCLRFWRVQDRPAALPGAGEKTS